MRLRENIVGQEGAILTVAASMSFFVDNKQSLNKGNYCDYWITKDTFWRRAEKEQIYLG